MRRAAFVLLAAACGHTEPAQVLVPATAPQPVSNACLRAYSAAADAWAEELELSEACAYLDKSVLVRVVAPAELPCVEVAGCSFEGEMYLSAALTDGQAVSVAIHEWLHLISLCETGNGDVEHLNVALWAGLDEQGARGDTIEAVALRAAQRGPCLGEP